MLLGSGPHPDRPDRFIAADGQAPCRSLADKMGCEPFAFQFRNQLSSKPV